MEHYSIRLNLRAEGLVPLHIPNKTGLNTRFKSVFIFLVLDEYINDYTLCIILVFISAVFFLLKDSFLTLPPVFFKFIFLFYFF